MSRVQLALRVSDLEGSIAFYRRLFDAEPAKRRPGYANFAIENPPLKLVLIEGAADQPTVLDHLGVEVSDTDQVTAATQRLTDSGLITLTENDTECCYALQDKVWVRGPGDERWEVYTVKGDADTLVKRGEGDGDCRCGEPDAAGSEPGGVEARPESAASGACC